MLNIFNFNIENILLITTSLINLILFVVIGIRPHKSENTLYFLLFNGSVFGWVTSVYLFRVLSLENVLSISAPQVIYIFAAIIPISLVLFIETFPNKKLKETSIVFFFTRVMPSLIILSCAIPGVFIESFSEGLNGVRYINFGSLYVYYFLYILGYFIFGLVRMISDIFLFTGVAKSRMKLIFFSILISSTVGMYANLILPTFENFNLFWLGPVFSLYMVITIGYTIVRYGLFDTKLIATESATFLLWGMMFIRMLFSKDVQELFINASLFIAVVSAGIYIIRSAIKEIILREDIEKSNEKLEQKNTELHRISEEKSEFVSLASHQIRGPLTSLNGYISLLHDGDLGSVSKEAKEALDIMHISCVTLSHIVNDYLDVSRIEQGKMHYDFTNVDVRGLLHECITELTPSFVKSNLTCINNVPIQTDTADISFEVRADRTKLKQVIMNIIDNAIKYTPQGSITVSAYKKDEKTVRIEVKDTGVGIAPAVMPKLFIKFSRAPDASEANIFGTGLGLFIAKSFIEAHEGHLWAESEGSGKGSLFVIEMRGV